VDVTEFETILKKAENLISLGTCSLNITELDENKGGDYSRAIKYFRNAEDLLNNFFPDSLLNNEKNKELVGRRLQILSVLYNNKAIAHWRNKERDNTEQLYQKALELSSNNQTIRDNYENFLIESGGEPPDDLKSATFYHKSGQVHYDNKIYEESIRCLEEAYRLDGSDPKIQKDYEAVISNYALELYNEEKYSEACQQLKKITETNNEHFLSENPLIYYNSGMCFVKLADYLKAKESFEKALEENPNDIRVQYSLAWVLSKTDPNDIGVMKEAKEYYYQIIENTNKNDEDLKIKSVNNLACICYDEKIENPSNHYKTILDFLKLHEKLCENSPEYWQNRGQIHIALGSRYKKNENPRATEEFLEAKKCLNKSSELN